MDGHAIAFASICNGTPAETAPKIAEALLRGRRDAHAQQGHSGATTSTETLYVNQYLTVRNGTLPTKHVYLGDARVASKVESNATTNNTYWYHSDHIQSTQYVTTSRSRLVVPAPGVLPGRRDLARRKTRAAG